MLDARALAFRPTGDSGVDVELAGSLSNDPKEQTQIILMLREARKAYEQELHEKRRIPNLADALTFYLVMTVTAYQDAPEPSDAREENVFLDAVEYLRQRPEIASMTDREKEVLNDRLVYVGGLVAFGYLTGKQENNPQVVTAFRTLAGTALRSLLKVDPRRVRFENDQLVVE